MRSWLEVEDVGVVSSDATIFLLLFVSAWLVMKDHSDVYLDSLYKMVR